MIDAEPNPACPAEALFHLIASIPPLINPEAPVTRTVTLPIRSRKGIQLFAPSELSLEYTFMNAPWKTMSKGPANARKISYEIFLSQLLL